MFFLYFAYSDDRVLCEYLAGAMVEHLEQKEASLRASPKYAKLIQAKREKYKMMNAKKNAERDQKVKITYVIFLSLPHLKDEVLVWLARRRQWCQPLSVQC